MTYHYRKWISALLALCLLLPSLTAAAAEAAPGETVTETTAAATEPKVSAPEEQSNSVIPYYVRFGLLHAHTDLSDGTGSVEEAFRYASQVEGLDFFAVTDHSDSFDNALSGSLAADGAAISAKWAAGKAAAAAVTNEKFLGIFGFEMSWPEDKRLGHITTFGTPGWASWDQEAFSNPATALTEYYKALAAVPGSISQFCHPGEHYGDFNGFGQWSKDYGDALALVEVSSGQEGTAWSQYTAALDAGWHVAPAISQNNHNGQWGDAGNGRTVVLTDGMTESALFSAIRSRRVYATQDKDLQLYFSLNGYTMGTTMPVEEELQLDLTWYDPTDETLGKAEVVSEGGRVLAAVTPEETDVAIAVPAGFRYYYLRVTQPDGDVAVTAPVWVDLPDNVQIVDFETALKTPDQGTPVNLSLTLENETREAITPDAVELYLGQTRVQALEDPKAVPAGGSTRYDLVYTHPEAGPATLRVLVQAGEERMEQSLELDYQPRNVVTGLIIDASHENENIGGLTALKTLAAEAGLTVTTVDGEMPEGGDVLLIQQPGRALEEEFIQAVTDFLDAGGNLILSGSGSEALLEALGSNLALTDTSLEAGTTETFQKNEAWCANLAEGQVFAFGAGNAVTGGKWLVKSGSNVILAWEKRAAGGNIFLSGCGIFQEEALAAAESDWQLPRANRTILRNILGEAEAPGAWTDIEDVRKGTQGQQYKIKGYVTAGTENPGNSFPDTIYLQDDTGGIAVTGLPALSVQVGEPIELIGTLAQEGGNLVLKYEKHNQPGGDYLHYDPDVRYCKAATDYAARGGELVKIQGKVTALVKTGDKKGILRLTVKDSRGDTAIVEIAETIFSGTTGKNELASTIKKDRNVSAMGLLHINEKGEKVLRVRDCDEVVYVKADADPTSPSTGDRFWWLWILG